MQQAHDKLSLPLKSICSDVKHDPDNDEDENIPFLGLQWNRKDDNIKFNGSFTLTKKNQMGHSKNLDISQINKKIFKDLNWLKNNVTKRIILRLTMSYFNPLGALLSISLANYKLLSSRLMTLTDINRYDQAINNEALLLEIGKHFDLLSQYKKSKLCRNICRV